MATRRQLGMGGERDEEGGYGVDDLAALESMFGLAAGGSSAGEPFQSPEPEPDPLMGDRSGLQPPALPQYERAIDTGSGSTPRELGREMGSDRPGQYDFMAGIPDSVTTEPETFNGAPEMMTTPLEPQGPAPAASRGLPPSIAPVANGPTRRTFSSAPSMLFGDASPAASGMFGGPAGLTEGGMGLGGADSGEAKGTPFMLALLRALKGGG